MKIFSEMPPPGDMERKHRMKRLHERLVKQALYVKPIYLDETFSEVGHFIVAVDDPYLVASQGDQG